MPFRIRTLVVMAVLTLLAMALVYWFFPDCAAAARHFLRSALRVLL